MSNSCLEVGRFGVALWELLAAAQPRYDLLLKGHVIDPANHVSAVRDVAIAAGKILAVAENIPAASANKTEDSRQGEARIPSCHVQRVAKILQQHTLLSLR